MKINNSTTHKKAKIILGSAAAVILFAGAALSYTESHHITNLIKNPFSHTASQTAQQAEQATKNDPTLPSANAKQESQPAAGVSSSQTTNQVPVSPQTTVTITTLNETNHLVNITANITNPAPNGACTITFSITGARPVTRTVQTTNNTCSSAISDQEFSMLGTWKVTVNYFANNTQANTTGKITIQ